MSVEDVGNEPVARERVPVRDGTDTCPQDANVSSVCETLGAPANEGNSPRRETANTNESIESIEKLQRSESYVLTAKLEEELERCAIAGELQRIGVGHPREDIRAVVRTYLLLICLNVFINYDSGAVPASVGQIQAELGLTSSNMGLVGSMPYWGLFLVSPVLGVLLKRFSQKEVLGVLLFLNAGMCIMFSYAKSFPQMLVARLLIGITQGGFVIYSPCWVDAMAPPSAKTLWMGIMQAVVPIGVVIGYFTTGFMTTYNVHWSLSLVCQAGVITILATLYVLTPYKYVDDFAISPRLEHLRREWMESRGLRVEGEKRPSTSSPLSDVEKRRHPLAGWSKTCSLATNMVFVSVTFTLCALWFVVTGIQYWATEFFVQEFHVRRGLVVSMFSIVALTGPTVGVVIGAMVTDMRGGYTGEGPRRKALRQSFFCACVATVFGLTAGMIEGRPGLPFWIEIVLVWGVLAFGGAIVPAATGVMVSSVPEESRQLASGVGQAMYNLFGYAIGTLVPGVVISNYGMRWGMRVLFGWALFGVLGMSGALLAVGSCPWQARDHIAKALNADVSPKGGTVKTVSDKV